MEYETPVKKSTPKAANLKLFSDGPIAFADFILPLYVTPSPRGDFIALCKTLINVGAFPHVMAWADLYRFMVGRHATPETINEARKLFRQYQKSDQGASPSPQLRETTP
jgi:hypothetical protein